MAIMTPRGLKIRLEADWAFTLIGRLWQRDRSTDAFRVLKTCEGIESVPAALAFVAGVLAIFGPYYSWWAVPVACVSGRAIGTLLTQFGVFVLLRPMGILALGTVLAWTPSSIIMYHLPLLIAGGIVVGWAIVLVWPLAWLAGFVAQHTVASCLWYWRYRRLGKDFAFTSSEVNFFNAYRLHADRLGVTRDFGADDDEVETALWQECLLDYATKYPESVARFDTRLAIVGATRRMHITGNKTEG